MSCRKLAGADLREDRNFERADLRTSTVLIEIEYCKTIFVSI